MRIQKNSFKFIAILLASGVNLAEATTLLLGNNLIIGPQGNNNITAMNAVAIGRVNIDADSTLGVGQYLGIYGSYSVTAGVSNLVFGSGSFVGGANNYNYGNENLIVGKMNYILSQSSINAGEFNNSAANRSLTVGYNHYIDAKLTDGIVAGIASAAVSKPALLVIGNGSEPLAVPIIRKNAFIVYKDGDVVISKRQGDISMGIYE